MVKTVAELQKQVAALEKQIQILIFEVSTLKTEISGLRSVSPVYHNRYRPVHPPRWDPMQPYCHNLQDVKMLSITINDEVTC